MALLIADLDFVFQPNIRTLCLPVLGTTFDYSTCMTMTWSRESGTPHLLKFQIQPRSKCKERLPSAYLRPNSTLDESLMCVIDASEQKTFSLNSGAPLFCPMPSDPNRYTQAGIVIGSVNRSDAISGLIVNMAHLMTWIFEQFGPHNISLNYYYPANECLCNCD